MRNNKMVTAVIVLLFVAIVFVVVKFSVNGNGSLVSPGVGLIKSAVGKVVNQSPTSAPTQSYNAPKEIKYGSGTDLQKELETINPQVLDSDFQP